MRKLLNSDKIERGSLAEKVALVLRKAIIQGKFAPGERLPEIWLSKQLGVSRAPIREAFRILEIEGLVEINLQKGARVREITAKDIENIYELRSTLDSLAVRLAMSNLQENHLMQLEKFLNQMKGYMKKGDIHSYRRLNTEFHTFFYQRSCNDWLYNVNNSLMNHIMRLRSLSLSMSERLHQSYKEHMQIVDAVKKGNIGEAEEVAKRHTKEAGKFVLRLFLERERASMGMEASV